MYVHSASKHHTDSALCLDHSNGWDLDLCAFVISSATLRTIRGSIVDLVFVAAVACKQLNDV